MFNNEISILFEGEYAIYFNPLHCVKRII